MTMDTIVCILGWHFKRSFYRSIQHWQSVADCWCIAHKPRPHIPDDILQILPSARILVQPNRGYDWGGYQKFLKKGLWRNYEYVIFIHDDVVLKAGAGVLLQICKDRLKACSVLGNSRMQPKIRAGDFARSYAHASWKPLSPEFTHDNVRGSFFATTREALEKLGSFEVFWDRFHISPGMGNWSTRATCAKMEYFLGPECFGFLSDTPLESDYLIEEIRGGQDMVSTGIPFVQRLLFRLVTMRAEKKMETFWNKKMKG